MRGVVGLFAVRRHELTDEVVTGPVSTTKPRTASRGRRRPGRGWLLACWTARSALSGRRAPAAGIPGPVRVVSNGVPRIDDFSFLSRLALSRRQASSEHQ
ncbi:conserved hypothetical protein [Streptomyces sviceus ATCC 29083]|uniref:Uncharacterized protein n=1 Tax=Streptomyces sviceus (strain ATCC 29083 / DSM 924 / JCM 4929 / NBRC 13980 / NCIMB 11184 / NRRL 5439 / UC 5370) TaxID=463191 RepID=B5HPH8_STRX2|nr:conserved hypothetical protein [Streptomyces sviceus ATCC 29083]